MARFQFPILRLLPWSLKSEPKDLGNLARNLDPSYTRNIVELATQAWLRNKVDSRAVYYSHSLKPVGLIANDFEWPIGNPRPPGRAEQNIYRGSVGVGTGLVI
jgi:hypothetical protein